MNTAATARVRRRIAYKDPRVGELARDVDEALRTLSEQLTSLGDRIAELEAQPDAPPGTTYTDEEAQDAVGGILADTPTVAFTYDDATPAITADVPDFTGDSGSGGAPGAVPAPASGDAAAEKFLSAAGGWAVPASGGSRLWSRPLVAHARDWECELADLPVGWVWLDAAGAAATPVQGITPYTGFTTGPPRYTRTRGAFVQCPANSTNYTLTQPYAAPTDAWFVSQIGGIHRGAAVNNDSTCLMVLTADNAGKPNIGDNYIYIGIELDAGAYQIDFQKRVAGVSTTVATTADADQGVGIVWEYVALQKIGTNVHAWAFSNNGQGYYLGVTSFAPTIAHVGFWLQNVTNSAPAPSIVRLGFFRTLDTAAGYPGQ